MAIKNSVTELENYKNTGTLDVQTISMNGTDLSPGTPGTVDASKMVVVDSNKDISGFRHVTITGNLVTGSTTLSEAELAVLDSIGSTTAEIDRQCDVSAQTETIDASGVISVTKRITKIVSTGAGAITIAAPDASMVGMVKIVTMTGGEHDITLDLTNVQGQSSGTTATFSDINDTLVLVAGTLKWNVVGEAGVALS